MLSDRRECGLQQIFLSSHPGATLDAYDLRASELFPAFAVLAALFESWRRK
jgi:hypothetical protein